MAYRYVAESWSGGGDGVAVPAYWIDDATGEIRFSNPNETQENGWIYTAGVNGPEGANTTENWWNPQTGNEVQNPYSGPRDVSELGTPSGPFADIQVNPGGGAMLATAEVPGQPDMVWRYANGQWYMGPRNTGGSFLDDLGDSVGDFFDSDLGQLLSGSAGFGVGGTTGAALATGNIETTADLEDYLMADAAGLAAGYGLSGAMAGGAAGTGAPAGLAEEASMLGVGDAGGVAAIPESIAGGVENMLSEELAAGAPELDPSLYESFVGPPTGTVQEAGLQSSGAVTSSAPGAGAPQVIGVAAGAGPFISPVTGSELPPIGQIGDAGVPPTDPAIPAEGELPPAPSDVGPPTGTVLEPGVQGSGAVVSPVGGVGVPDVSAVAAGAGPFVPVIPGLGAGASEVASQVINQAGNAVSGAGNVGNAAAVAAGLGAVASQPPALPDTGAEMRAAEEARLARTAANRSRVDSAFAGFNDDYYGNIAKAFRDYYSPQLGEGYDEEQRRLLYAAPGGVGSTEFSRQIGNLQTARQRDFADLSTRAHAAGEDARSAVAQQRAAVLSQAEAAEDPETFGQQAAAAAQAAARPPVYSPLTDLFQRYTALAANSALARRAGYQPQASARDLLFTGGSGRGGSGSVTVVR
jgi:hypothetical protein